MAKRDRFIAELRDEARARGLPFRVEAWRGKGGHAMVWLGNRDDVALARDRPEDREKNSQGAGTGLRALASD
jgi:hypothetical protein